MSNEGDRKPVKQMSFEEAMAELETVVARLETDEVTLEDSIALYKRGAELRGRCQKTLSEAEEKVAKITTDAEGEARGTEPLDS